VRLLKLFQMKKDASMSHQAIPEKFADEMASFHEMK